MRLITEEIKYVSGGSGVTVEADKNKTEVTGAVYNCVCTSTSNGASGNAALKSSPVDCVYWCCPKFGTSDDRWIYFGSAFYASEKCSG